MANIVSLDSVATMIHEIRGRRVMLDSDLAKLYGVKTKNLNKAVKRNAERFPEDFMFRLSKKEIDGLRFQIGTSNRGGRRYLPFVFTQEGVAMLSSVLNSSRAIQVNIMIMRAFVKLRNLLSLHKELKFKLKELEAKIEGHDVDIGDIFEAIRQLMGIPHEHKKIGGFATK